jgi:hypothetical protein
MGIYSIMQKLLPKEAEKRISIPQAVQEIDDLNSIFPSA